MGDVDQELQHFSRDANIGSRRLWEKLFKCQRGLPRNWGQARLIIVRVLFLDEVGKPYSCIGKIPLVTTSHETVPDR